jgi:predicted site-specific integrase-resolvase
MAMEGYLDAADVAKQVGVSRETIHRYHVRGDIPLADERVGRTPLWKEETIAKWLATRPGHGWRAGKKT